MRPNPAALRRPSAESFDKEQRLADDHVGSQWPLIDVGGRRRCSGDHIGRWRPEIRRGSRWTSRATTLGMADRVATKVRTG